MRCAQSQLTLRSATSHAGLLRAPVWVLGLPLIGLVAGCAARIDAEGEVAAAGATTVGAGGAKAAPTHSDFVPDAPPAYDDKNGLGSFEDNAGFGWDTCHTRTPEILALQSGGSDGPTCMSFQSVDDDAGAGFTSDQPSASQLYWWFKPAAERSENLYFDAKNLAGTAVGAIRFYGTDHLCGDEELLVEVDLAQLELRPAWATRCLTVTGLSEHQALGVAVTGGPHSLALDAFRFGPPCRTDL